MPAFAIVAFASSLPAVAVARRARVPSTPVPAAEAASSAGVVSLRAPARERILVMGGHFTMGSTADEVAEALFLCRLEPARDDCKDELFAHEQPAHVVGLAPYWLDRTEVTARGYQRCVQAGACQALPLPSEGRLAAELPVTLVTWGDADAYCRWAGGALPTEAQWERAARGLTRRAFPWGRVYNPLLVNHGRHAWQALDASDGFLEAAPVGSFPSGATPEGLVDLSGNVEEWVADWYEDAYPAGAAIEPRGPATGVAKVLRGGGFVHARPWLRSASRSKDHPAARRAWRGFRCAYAAEP